MWVQDMGEIGAQGINRGTYVKFFDIDAGMQTTMLQVKLSNFSKKKFIHIYYTTNISQEF